VSKLIVGNKCDITSRREIHYDFVKDLAEDWRIQHIETSAKTSKNIDEIFQLIVTDIKKQKETSCLLAKQNKTLSLNQKNEKLNKCC
jgi:50S ribosomal subunit-associated GTPase HflX